MATPVQQQRRNIVVLGKTGAGKSTVANQILGSDQFKVSTSTQSVTRRVTDGEAKVNVGDIDYNIKIIDTIGLFDSGPVTNKQVIQSIKSHFQKKVPESVNLVMFVFREGRFTVEEKNAFEYIITKFSKEISDISALIITNCELKSAKTREKIVAEFRGNPTTKPFADFVKKGIFAVGFPNIEEIDDEELRPIIQERIKKDKEELQLFVRSCGDELRLSRELFTEDFWEKIQKCQIL